MAQNMICLGKFHAHLKEQYFAIVAWKIYKYELRFLVVCFKSSVALTDFMTILSDVEGEVLKSPTNIVFLFPLSIIPADTS